MSTAPSSSSTPNQLDELTLDEKQNSVAENEHGQRISKPRVPLTHPFCIEVSLSSLQTQFQVVWRYMTALREHSLTRWQDQYKLCAYLRILRANMSCFLLSQASLPDSASPDSDKDKAASPTSTPSGSNEAPTFSLEVLRDFLLDSISAIAGLCDQDEENRRNTLHIPDTSDRLDAITTQNTPVSEGSDQGINSDVHTDKLSLPNENNLEEQSELHPLQPLEKEKEQEKETIEMKTRAINSGEVQVEVLAQSHEQTPEQSQSQLAELLSLLHEECVEFLISNLSLFYPTLSLKQTLLSKCLKISQSYDNDHKPVSHGSSSASSTYEIKPSVLLTQRFLESVFSDLGLGSIDNITQFFPQPPSQIVVDSRRLEVESNQLKTARRRKVAQAQREYERERANAAKKQWACEICTFLNNPALKSCSMCQTRRAGGASPAKVKMVHVPEVTSQDILAAATQTATEDFKRANDIYHQGCEGLLQVFDSLLGYCVTLADPQLLLNSLSPAPAEGSESEIDEKMAGFRAQQAIKGPLKLLARLTQQLLIWVNETLIFSRTSSPIPQAPVASEQSPEKEREVKLNSNEEKTKSEDSSSSSEDSSESSGAAGSNPPLKRVGDLTRVSEQTLAVLDSCLENLITRQCMLGSQILSQADADLPVVLTRLKHTFFGALTPGLLLGISMFPAGHFVPLARKIEMEMNSLVEQTDSILLKAEDVLTQLEQHLNKTHQAAEGSENGDNDNKEEDEEEASSDSGSLSAAEAQADPVCPKCEDTMVLSDYHGGLYQGGWCCSNTPVCPNGSALVGWERWWCEPCQEDYCFTCHPKSQARSSPDLEAANEESTCLVTKNQVLLKEARKALQWLFEYQTISTHFLTALLCRELTCGEILPHLDESEHYDESPVQPMDPEVKAALEGSEKEKANASLELTWIDSALCKVGLQESSLDYLDDEDSDDEEPLEQLPLIRTLTPNSQGMVIQHRDIDQFCQELINNRGPGQLFYDWMRACAPVGGRKNKFIDRAIRAVFAAILKHHGLLAEAISYARILHSYAKKGRPVTEAWTPVISELRAAWLEAQQVKQPLFFRYQQLRTKAFTTPTPGQPASSSGSTSVPGTPRRVRKSEGVSKDEDKGEGKTKDENDEKNMNEAQTTTEVKIQTPEETYLICIAPIMKAAEFLLRVSPSLETVAQPDHRPVRSKTASSRWKFLRNIFKIVRRFRLMSMPETLTRMQEAYNAQSCFKEIGMFFKQAENIDISLLAYCV